MIDCNLSFSEIEYFRKRILFFKIFYYLLRLSRNPSYGGILASKIQDATIDYGSKEQKIFTSDIFRKDLSLDQLYEEKYKPKIPDIKKLGQMKKNTFGYQYYLYITKNKLTIDGLPLRTSETSLLEYACNRRRRVHDFYHVLAEYDITVYEEVALNAFEYGMHPIPQYPIVILINIFRVMVKDYIKVKDLTSFLFESYLRGTQVKTNLISVKWEELFEEDINELRKTYGIPPRSDKRFIYEW